MVRFRGLAVLALALSAAPATAQTATAIQPTAFTLRLVPDDFPRVELSGSLGWQGVRKSGFDNWNSRYDTGTVAGTAGFFWTPHIRSDVTISRFGTGSMYETVPIAPVPGRPQTFRYFEHQFHTTSISPAVSYQFLENRWVHPSLSVGADVMREREEIVEQAPDRTVRSSATRYLVDPFVGAGAKFFVSEGIFIRTDLRYAFRGSADDRTSWTAGVGVEF